MVEDQKRFKNDDKKIQNGNRTTTTKNLPKLFLTQNGTAPGHLLYCVVDTKKNDRH